MAEQKPDSGKQNAAPRQQNRPHGRVYSLSFTLPKLIFSILFGVLALTWVFIFGIMLGRGHKPEEKVPKLAQIMPSALSRNTTMAPPPPAEVLRPEELKYQESLKGRTVASAPPRAAEPPKTKAAETKSGKADAKKSRQASSKDQTGKTQPKEKAKVDAAPPTTAKADPKAVDKNKTVKPEPATAGRYDYVYQVAAFKDGPPAEAMRGKLQASGLKPTVEKQKDGATTWYRILVSFRGTPEDTRGMRETLAKNGISRVILRSKKPLE